jgi:hypothetical protein
MKTFKALTTFAALLAVAAAAPAADKQTREEKNEEKLAKLLEGRVAGEPVSCIPSFQTNDLQVLDGVALVYGKGETIYVARPTRPDSMRVRWDDVIVINRMGGQLCHTDIIRTVDRMTGFTTGALFLDRFVPYKKQD